LTTDEVSRISDGFPTRYFWSFLSKNIQGRNKDKNKFNVNIFEKLFFQKVQCEMNNSLINFPFCCEDTVSVTYSIFIFEEK
jgi:hypothetical protein